MKMKKSAASAALKTNGTPTTTSAPVTTPAAPAPKPSTPVATATAASPAKTPNNATKSAGALTTIDVKIDVGFGNAVFLRGQGSGLNWEHGVPLACVDGSTWRWSQTVASPITFKVLINDQVWSAGSDLVVKPGQKLEVAPNFALG